MTTASTIGQLRDRIKKASVSSALSGGPVTLLAASKGQSTALIEEAITAGVIDFGENRVQEAEDKWLPLLEKHPNVRLHLIGPLQTNKVKEALALFHTIQTIDREKLADEIAKARSTGTDIRTKQFYIQVNTGEEPQKAGVLPKDADRLIDYCRTQLHLPLDGLMCIPPAGQPPAPHFAFLRSLAISHGLRELSMGMSEDFETAIRMGSTCVRLGRALFDPSSCNAPQA